MGHAENTVRALTYGIQAFHLLVIALAGWLNRYQQGVWWTTDAPNPRLVLWSRILTYVVIINNKYRLAFVVEEACVVRYDNERSKGDHRHYGDTEESYRDDGYLSSTSIAEWVNISGGVTLAGRHA